MNVHTRQVTFMRIIPLGINGFFPTFGRHTTSFLVLHRESAVLLDAGTGIARLTEPLLRDLLLPFRELHIVLSHYHLDHIIGLSYLVGILSNTSVSIYAPEPPLVEAHLTNALNTLLRQPFFSVPLEDFPMRPRVVSIRNDRFEVGGSTVFVRAQKHQGGSIGIRIEDLVFMTDTAVDPGAISFMSGARLLLHEVWLRDEDLPAGEEELLGHSFASGVVDLSLKAGVKRLMPIHLNPKRNADEVHLLGESLKREGLQVVVPVEGRIYEVDQGT
jgi:ribonuclease BN (tRNA processing enzyme)